MLPKVSIIIPVYNQETYIKECLESVLNQDYENFEVIVIDDGSTDNTPKILIEFGEKIKYARQKNQGPSIALNNGLRLAEGSLIGWLGSDDVYLPGAIKLRVKKLQEDPSIALVYTDYVMIDSTGNELKTIKCPFPAHEQFAKALLADNFINGSTVLMRRECYGKVELYDTTLKASMDGDMWFRLLGARYQFGHIAIPLVKYRVHQTNISHKFTLMQEYKDKVHLKALKNLSSQGFFTTSIEYEQLSYGFAKQFSFRSASASMKKSIEIRFSFKNAFLWILFKMLSNKLFVALLCLARKIIIIKKTAMSEGIKRIIWKG